MRGAGLVEAVEKRKVSRSGRKLSMMRKFFGMMQFNRRDLEAFTGELDHVEKG